MIKDLALFYICVTIYLTLVFDLITHPEPLGHRAPTSLDGKLDPRWPRGLDTYNLAVPGH